MKQKNIEQSLHRALNQAPAPDFEKLIGLPYVKLEQHDFITRQEEKQEVPPVRRYTAALSLCFALLLFVAGGWFYQYRLPNSMISLDVNPSIEIITNRHNEVLEVKAMNEDARKVLGDQDYRLKELDTAVVSIVTTVIDQGYLNTERNVIMVSVENKKAEKAEVLAAELNQVIKKSASARDRKPKILSQTLKKDKAAAKEAKKLEVSVGKLKLMKKIEASSETITVESLAHKSMAELLAIAEENEVDLKDTIKVDEEYAGDHPEVTPEQEKHEIDADENEKDSSDDENSAKSDHFKKDHENTLKEDQEGDSGDSEESGSENKEQGGKNKIKNKDDQERDQDQDKSINKGKSIDRGKSQNKDKIVDKDQKDKKGNDKGKKNSNKDKSKNKNKDNGAKDSQKHNKNNGAKADSEKSDNFKSDLEADQEQDGNEDAALSDSTGHSDTYDNIDSQHLNKDGDIGEQDLVSSERTEEDGLKSEIGIREDNNTTESYNKDTEGNNE